MDITREIFERRQVRKSRKQKDSFIGLIETHCSEKGYACTVESNQSGLIISRNIIVGNLDEAEIICTAHYDTCAVIPFPNFITPKNIIFLIFYSVLLAMGFVIIASIIALAIGWVSGFNPIVSLVTFPFIILLGLIQLLAGIPNKNTANDNTSGVITLLSIMDRISDTNRDKIAFVFFDNEELGLWGSRFFKRKHKAINEEKLLMNFDCVSDGDNILLVCTKAVRESLKFDCLKKCFEQNIKLFHKNLLIEKSSRTVYPSDQVGFRFGIGVAAMKKAPLIGLYLGRIHTSRDVIFQQENIDYLTKCVVDLSEHL